MSGSKLNRNSNICISIERNCIQFRNYIERAKVNRDKINNLFSPAEKFTNFIFAHENRSLLKRFRTMRHFSGRNEPSNWVRSGEILSGNFNGVFSPLFEIQVFAKQPRHLLSILFHSQT